RRDRACSKPSPLKTRAPAPYVQLKLALARGAAPAAAPPTRPRVKPNLPLSPPCRHSLAGHGAIRLRFGRKVEVSVCVTGVSGLALFLPKEHPMRAATRPLALVRVRLGWGSAPLAAQANPPPAQANPPPPPAQANPPPPPGSAAPQGPQYSS